MTDVFISYAREDRKFVQRLHDALASAGRESWVAFDEEGNLLIAGADGALSATCEECAGSTSSSPSREIA